MTADFCPFAAIGQGNEDLHRRIAPYAAHRHVAPAAIFEQRVDVVTDHVKRMARVEKQSLVGPPHASNTAAVGARCPHDGPGASIVVPELVIDPHPQVIGTEAPNGPRLLTIPVRKVTLELRRYLIAVEHINTLVRPTNDDTRSGPERVRDDRNPRAFRGRQG